MNITGAEFTRGKLTLLTEGGEPLRFAKSFKPGEYEIRRVTKKRSLDANSYCWALIGQLATVMRMDRDVVYRDAICAVGAAEQVMIRSEAFDDFARVWGQKGLGWVAQKLDERDGWALVNAYYGSSAYSTAQMSALIDYIKQDCEAVGIDVDDERIKTLLEEWDAR